MAKANPLTAMLEFEKYARRRGFWENSTPGSLAGDPGTRGWVREVNDTANVYIKMEPGRVSVWVDLEEPGWEPDWSVEWSLNTPLEAQRAMLRAILKQVQLDTST